MRFDQDILDEIRTRLTLSELVGRTVALKRQGREFAGLSPFNKEKTPSFFVNDDKRFYHCFSSGKHGDAFTWLMETQGLSFPEAVERLANETGVALPALDPQAAARAEHVRGLSDWLEEACAFFRAELQRKRGEDARAYLERRGLSAQDCERFEVGFAPDGWAALKDHLIAKGAKEDHLRNAGLVARSDKTGKLFDYFRNRVMFPIRDARGRLCAFGGRALSKDDKAKYLNSPESDLFHKGSMLYRYGEARAALMSARGSDAPRGLIVAEGYMDVIALAKTGFEHAVAPLGTALTEDQLALLWRASPEPVLCFDGDAAGVRAAHRAIDRALAHLEPGRSLSFALLPDGQDPDDLIRAKGADAMGGVLEQARPLVDMVWERELAVEPSDTPERRAGLKKRLYQAAASIADQSVAALYKQELLGRFDARFPRGRAPWRNTAAPSGRFDDAKPDTKSRTAGLGDGELAFKAVRLLAALLARPALLEDCGEALAVLELKDPDHDRIRHALLDHEAQGEGVDKSALYAHLRRLGIEDAADRLIADERLTVASVCAADAPEGEAASAWKRAASEFVRLTGREGERSALVERMKECRARGDRAGLTKAVRALVALDRADAPAS